MTSESVKQLKKTAYTVLISIIIVSIFEFGQSYFSKTAEAAPKGYVDLQIIEVKAYSDKGDEGLKVEIDGKASNEKVDAMLTSLTRVIEQNDKLYLFLLEQKGK